MSARTGVSLDQYLGTIFPGLDQEYRDGELLERTLPDYLHGKTQSLLAAFFAGLRKKLPVHACTETRMRVGPKLYLIPDVAVFHPTEPARAPETPPLVAIEILSPDDRLAVVREKLEEYRAWGVRHVWLVDPYSRRLCTYEVAINDVASLGIPELGLELTPEDVFG